MSRGDRNRNARLERLRVLVPASNAIVGIDLADSKQIVFQPRHEPVKDAGVSPRNALAGRPIDFRGPGCQASSSHARFPHKSGKRGRSYRAYRQAG